MFVLFRKMVLRRLRRYSKGLIFFVFFLTRLTTQEEEDGPLVTIDTGQLLGKIEESRDGRTFYQFLGIPYGKIPQRFEISEPADSWNGTYNATAYGAVCLSNLSPAEPAISVRVENAEDCLFINVHTPIRPSTINSSTKLIPVLFGIHGGGWIVGSGADYGPKYFIDEDIVVVTINYRLGPFGFLNLGIKEAAGNQGGKDMVLALKWVQRNIAAFGGNPTQVTIQGESAGGISVSNLIISPMTQNQILFANAIMQSGVATMILALNPRPKYYARLLAEGLNCTNNENNTQEMVQCLRNLTVTDIMNYRLPSLLVSSSDWNNEKDYAELKYNFCVEDEIEGVEPFLTGTPRNLINKGDFRRIPVLLGANERERYQTAQRIFHLYPERLDQLNTEWNRIAPMQILFSYYDYGQSTEHGGVEGGEYELPNAARNELSQRLKQFYFPNVTYDDGSNNGPIPNTTESFNGVEFAAVDSIFYQKHRQFAKLMTEKGPQHEEELVYLFDKASADLIEIPVNSSDYQFSKAMVKLWVSFMINGKPTEIFGNNSTEEWKPFNNSSVNNEVIWYHIDDDGITGKVEEERFRQRMEFWDDVDKTYYEKNANNNGLGITVSGLSSTWSKFTLMLALAIGIVHVHL